MARTKKWKKNEGAKSDENKGESFSKAKKFAGKKREKKGGHLLRSKKVSFKTLEEDETVTPTKPESIAPSKEKQNGNEEAMDVSEEAPQNGAPLSLAASAVAERKRVKSLKRLQRKETKEVKPDTSSSAALTYLETFKNDSKPASNNPSAAKRRRIKLLKRLRRKETTGTKPNTDPSTAMTYLETWKNDRINWKFRKNLQLFLINNYFDSTRIPDSHFGILLEYFKDIKGNAKNITLDSAKLTVSYHDEQHKGVNEKDIPPWDAAKVHRARQIVALLK